MSNPRIKLTIKTERELNKLQKCGSCGEYVKYRELYFYVDESNISITNSSKGICIKCKTKNRNHVRKV